VIFNARAQGGKDAKRRINRDNKIDRDKISEYGKVFR
jgi:hypothetical protein